MVTPRSWRRPEAEPRRRGGRDEKYEALLDTPSQPLERCYQQLTREGAAGPERQEPAREHAAEKRDRQDRREDADDRRDAEYGHGRRARPGGQVAEVQRGDRDDLFEPRTHG